MRTRILLGVALAVAWTAQVAPAQDAFEFSESSSLQQRLNAFQEELNSRPAPNPFLRSEESEAGPQHVETAELELAPVARSRPPAEIWQTASELPSLHENVDPFDSAMRSTQERLPLQLTQYSDGLLARHLNFLSIDPLGSHTGGPGAGMGSPQPPAPPPEAHVMPPEMPPPRFSNPLTAKWGTGQGFQLQTEDEQFTLQMHNLTQFDMRVYKHTANVPHGLPPNIPGASGPNNTFTFPRVWLIFNGTLTKNWEWMLAPAFGFDNVNLLDAWLNAHYDDRFQVKAGRYKTPFTYEFYAEPIQGLISPERSLFFNNFGLNRANGVMLHGTVFDKHVDYAIGAYNGQRNGYLSNTNSKDVVGYVNVRPFMNSEWCALQRLDIGGSFDYGDQDNPVAAGSPTVLRTNVATNGNLDNGVEFLQFAATMQANRERALGPLHAAYYHQGLSLIAELQGGTQSYANTAPGPGGSPNSRVPIGSWYVQGGYFITGETTNFRGTVKPLCPFSLAEGGIGAIELAGRFNQLNISDRIFTSGLVDTVGGNTWTNNVNLIDLGVNWYPNQWIKYSATWEHAQFGDPVTYRPGQSSFYNDMFMLRSQIWF